MTWQALMRIVADVGGPGVAATVCERAKLELQGVRVTVGARAPISRAAVDAVAPGRPREAARALGVSVRTVYRALHDVR